MKLWRAISRRLPASRLAATALIILFLISPLVGVAYRPEAAEAFAYTFAMLMGVFFWVAIIGLPIYGLVSYVRSRRK